MPSDIRVILPDREEMIRRLTSVISATKLVDDLYPRFAELAGQGRIVGGFVLHMMQSIDDHVTTLRMPFSVSEILYATVPLWLDALLEHDAAQEAKAFHAEIMARADSTVKLLEQ